MQDRQQTATRRTTWTAALSLLFVVLAGCAAGDDVAVADARTTVATSPANPAGEADANNPAAATVEMTNDLRFSPETVRVQPGESFSKTFDVPGTYRYFCIPHEMQGMLGTAIVE